MFVFYADGLVVVHYKFKIISQFLHNNVNYVL